MDQELEPSNVLTSEALRAAALAASARRGVPIARKRIVLRWTVWLLWRWLLPMIGLVTVLAALLAFASVMFWGPAKVLDTSQVWLAEQWGGSLSKAVASPFDYQLDKPSTAFPTFHANDPSVIPQLQIDRNYSKQEPGNAALSVAPTAPVISTVPTPSSPPKPPGAQP